MQEVNLYDLIKFYVKKWPYFVLAAVIGVLIGVGFTKFIQTPMYQSKATLLVVGAQRPANSEESVALNNYLELFQSRRVLSSVISENSYDGTYEELASHVTAKNDKSTDIMKVSISSDDPKLSKAMLEGAINSFRLQVNELYAVNPATIKTVDQPNFPSEASNVKPFQQIALASGVCILVLIIALFAIYDYKQSDKRKVNPYKIKKAANNIKLSKSESHRKKRIAQK